MKIFLLVLELILGIVLTISVLLHSAKGEGMGAIGGQARMFSSHRDLEAGLTRFTAVVGGLFLVLAFVLSIFY